MDLRPVVLLVLLGPATASAGRHTVEAGYDAAATASAASDGGLLSLSAGGEAADTISFGGYQIVIAAGASAHHSEGAVRATGLSTSAQLAAGPAPLPPSNKDAYRTVVFPLSFELGHEGDLAALPRMSDRLDVRRAPYAWQRFTGATRLVRIEYAEDGFDDEQDPDHLYPEDRQTGSIDVVPVRASVATVAQGDARRIDATTAIGLAGGEVRWPAPARMEMLSLESKVSRLGEDATTTTRTLWFLRIDMPVPSGVTYTISWGKVLSVDDVGERDRVIDHDQEGDIVSLGLGGGTEREGIGIQFLRREAYVALDGRAMFENKGWFEMWFHARSVRWYGRTFFAHTRRIEGTDQEGDWTGGIEVDASRDLGPFHVGVQAEAGRSFYGPIDGGEPTPGFGAYGALTVRRADGRRWFY